MQDAARVARAMAPSVFEPFDPEKHGSPVNHEFAQAMWLKKATAAISAMPDSFDRGWNAAIEAAADVVCGYIHPDYGRLPGEAFASAQVRQLKKDTG